MRLDYLCISNLQSMGNNLHTSVMLRGFYLLLRNCFRVVFRSDAPWKFGGDHTVGTRVSLARDLLVLNDCSSWYPHHFIYVLPSWAEPSPNKKAVNNIFVHIYSDLWSCASCRTLRMLDKLVLWTFRESFPFWRRCHTLKLKDRTETGIITRSVHYRLRIVVQTLTTHASIMALAAVVTVGHLQTMQLWYLIATL